MKKPEELFDEEFKDLSHTGHEEDLPCGTVKIDVKSFISTHYISKVKVEEELDKIIKDTPYKSSNQALLGLKEKLL